MKREMATFAVNGLHNLPIITKMHSALESKNIALPQLCNMSNIVPVTLFQ